jgi:hypothetical protein
MGWFGRKSIADGPARIVGKRRVVVMDGECVDTAEDYVDVIRDIAAITDGTLVFDAITCEEEERGSGEPARAIALAQGGRAWTGRVHGDTDWIDNGRLVGLLNRVLADLGAARRVHAIHHDTWGQELGVVFATDEELARLRERGYMLDEGGSPLQQPDDEVLAVDRELHGVAFRAGTTVAYWSEPPFDAMEVRLAEPHTIAGLVLPAGAAIHFHDDGGILCGVFDGKRVPFEDGAWRLGQAEPME